MRSMVINSSSGAMSFRSWRATTIISAGRLGSLGLEGLSSRPSVAKPSVVDLSVMERRLGDCYNRGMEVWGLIGGRAGGFLRFVPSTMFRPSIPSARFLRDVGTSQTMLCWLADETASLRIPFRKAFAFLDIALTGSSDG